MTSEYKVAYYIRKSIQHLPPVVRLFGELPGPVLVSERAVADHIEKKYPELAKQLVYCERVRHAKAYVKKHGIRVVIYPAFKSLGRVLGVEIFHGGMSDKRYLETSLISLYDLVLFPGEKSRDKVAKVDLLKWVLEWKVIGYPKFDPLIDKTLSYEPVFDNGNPTVLYAPTWISETRTGAAEGEHRHSPHGESSLPRWGVPIIEQLPEGVNLIIKPHNKIFPAGQHFHDALDERIEALGLQDRARVVYDDNILPYMDQTDVFISDISSACYEWFHFDRPILYANPAPEHYRPSDDISSNTYAWQAGDVIGEEGQIGRMITENLERDPHRAKRNEIFRYTVFQPDGNATRRQADAIRELYDRHRDTPYATFFRRWRFKHLWRKFLVKVVLGRGLILD